MSGDPNSVRDDILGSLSLIEATIVGMADGPDKLRLAFASAALRRANEKLRDEGNELAPVIELHTGHSAAELLSERDGDKSDIEIYGAGA